MRQFSLGLFCYLSARMSQFSLGLFCCQPVCDRLALGGGGGVHKLFSTSQGSTWKSNLEVHLEDLLLNLVGTCF